MGVIQSIKKTLTAQPTSTETSAALAAASAKVTETETAYAEGRGSWEACEAARRERDQATVRHSAAVRREEAERAAEAAAARDREVAEVRRLAATANGVQDAVSPIVDRVATLAMQIHDALREMERLAESGRTAGREATDRARRLGIDLEIAQPWDLDGRLRTLTQRRIGRALARRPLAEQGGYWVDAATVADMHGGREDER